MAKKSKTKSKPRAKTAKKKAAKGGNPCKNMHATLWLQEFSEESGKKGTDKPEDWDQAIESLLEWCSDNCNAAVFQLERNCSKNLHLQCFFQMKNKTRYSTVAKRIKENTPLQGNLDKMFSNVAQSVAYCTKPTGPWKYHDGLVKENITVKGPFWVNQKDLKKHGQRSDLQEAARLIQNGASMADIADMMPTTYIRNHRGMKELQFTKKKAEAKKIRDVKFILCIGPAGTGKSYDARHTIAQQYGFSDQDVFSLSTSGSSLWFDGYIGEKVLLIDDFEPQAIRREEFLRITDIYEYTAAIKGGFTVGEWELVIVTTNYTMLELFGVPAYDADGRPDGMTLDLAYTSRLHEVIDYDGMPDRRSNGNGHKVTKRTEMKSGGVEDVPQ